jgi:hypothetical protein
MTGTGLEKCIPMNLSGLWVEVESSVILKEEVLLARIVRGGQISSNSWKIFFFRSRFSGTASIIRSASFPASSRERVPRIRPRIPETCSAENYPFSRDRFRFFWMAWRPRSRKSFSMSLRLTWNPDWAATWAIPFPINPAPITPILSIFINPTPISGSN